MNIRCAISALAATVLCASAWPALAQGSGIDPDRTGANNPVQPARPEAAPAPAQPRAGDRRDQGHRDANRPQPPRGDNDRHDGQRGDSDRRHYDRRDGDRRSPGYRNYGYVFPVVPQRFYYGAPPVYYPAPPVYYGGVPQPYYPYATAQPLFQPGQYLPPEFRNQQNVVEDWEWRGLSAPPLGYHWFFLGGPDSFALVADATGWIVSVVAPR